MKKQTVRFVFAVISLILLTGCWDKFELEEHAYVVVLGLDKREDNLIDITFQIANPQVGSTDIGTAQSEVPSDVVTITATDILAAKELSNSIVSRKMSFRHLQTIIVGEELAKSDLVNHVLASAMFEPEVRYDISLHISKEKAKDFIHKNKPKLETRPHKYYAFMEQRWKDTGYVPYATLNSYFERLQDGLFLAPYATTEREENEPKKQGGYLAGEVPQQAGDPVQMIGSAVFKNGKMIDTINSRETRISLFLRPRTLTKNVADTFPDPIDENYQIAVRIIEAQSPEIQINTKKEPAEVNVTLPVKLQIFSDPSLANYSLNMENQSLLRKSLKEEMEKRAEELVKKTQEEYKAEPFLWSLKARKEFKTWREYDDYNWDKKYVTANVKVNYDVEIESLDSQNKPHRAKNIGNR